MVKKIRIWVGKGELIPPNSIVKLTYEFKIVSAWAGVGIFSLKGSCPSYRQKENFFIFGPPPSTFYIFSLFPNFWEKFESANFADVTERSQDLRVHNSFFVRREPHLRRPGQKLLSFWVWLVVRSRDRATPPTW